MQSAMSSAGFFVCDWSSLMEGWLERSRRPNQGAAWLKTKPASGTAAPVSKRCGPPRLSPAGLPVPVSNGAGPCSCRNDSERAAPRHLYASSRHPTVLDSLP